MSNNNYSIHEDWEEYYIFLEALRRTGVCNMFGAGVYIVEAFHVDNQRANEILTNWIENYNELNKKYGWQK